MSNEEKAKNIRRIVQRSQETIEEALADRKQRRQAPPKAKPTYKPLTEVAQLERQVYLANLALNRFEVMLEDGDELNSEEGREFLQHQDSLRKLMTTLSALKAKANLTKKTDKELAVEMLEAGIDKETVLGLYGDDKQVVRAIKEHS